MPRDPKDAESEKYLRREFNRRLIDLGQADLRVMHGVAYIRGVVKPLPGGSSELKKVVTDICQHLRGTGKIRDYSIDAIFRDA
jgi:hypothetical protein